MSSSLTLVREKIFSLGLQIRRHRRTWSRGAGVGGLHCAAPSRLPPAPAAWPAHLSSSCPSPEAQSLHSWGASSTKAPLPLPQVHCAGFETPVRKQFVNHSWSQDQPASQKTPIPPTFFFSVTFPDVVSES